MKYGYIRASTKDQKIDRQLESLLLFEKTLIIKNIYIDKATGKNFDRKNYKKLKSILKYGDELIIHELDRFGRNKEEIKNELEWLKNNGITPRILNIPTTLYTCHNGQEWLSDMINNILFEVYSTLAQQERDTISKRTKEGLASARKKGNFGGRPKTQIEKIEKSLMMKERKEPILKILKECGISRGTFYKYLNIYKKQNK